MFATTNVSATTFLINRPCLYNFCAQNPLDLDAWFPRPWRWMRTAANGTVATEDDRGGVVDDGGG